MNVLVILQGPVDGDERADNGLRLAGSLARRKGVELRIFCFGDADGCAVAGQQLPNGSRPFHARTPVHAIGGRSEHGSILGDGRARY